MELKKWEIMKNDEMDEQWIIELNWENICWNHVMICPIDPEEKKEKRIIEPIW